MKTILEITPDSKTRYTMPDETYDIVARSIDLRLVKGVKPALAMLPETLRGEVEITALPKEQDGMRGLTANVMIVNEVAELTDAEAAALGMPNQAIAPSATHEHS